MSNPARKRARLNSGSSQEQAENAQSLSTCEPPDTGMISRNNLRRIAKINIDSSYLPNDIAEYLRKTVLVSRIKGCSDSSFYWRDLSLKFWYQSEELDRNDAGKDAWISLLCETIQDMQLDIPGLSLVCSQGGLLFPNICKLTDLF